MQVQNFNIIGIYSCYVTDSNGIECIDKTWVSCKEHRH